MSGATSFINLKVKSKKWGGGGGSYSSREAFLSKRENYPTTTKEREIEEKGGLGEKEEKGKTQSQAEELLARVSGMGHSNPWGLLQKYGFERLEAEVSLVFEAWQAGDNVRNPAGLLVYRLQAKDPRQYGEYYPEWRADLAKRREAIQAAG